ncbi:MAG: MFS transporter [Dehalococcoidia bacterium]|nr:MFS transporter [Dehalococcoidia bacterium]
MLAQRLKPIPVYMLLSGGYAFFTTLVFSTNLVFQTQEAGLNPIQLVLIGTALEASIFICEVPTGILADVYSRRLSVLIGLVLAGLGLMLGGAFPIFWIILLSQPLWGIGQTFISGAKQAWIADEIGPENAGAVFLRSSQVETICRIAALPLGIAIGALLDLNTPILIGGALLVVLAFVLLPVMPETGFTRLDKIEGGALNSMKSTLVAGGSLVRRSPLLITVFGIAAFYGMASEGFERLWTAHFYYNLGYPDLWDLEFVVWIGVIRTGAALLSLAAVEFLRRRVDTNSHAVVSRGLFLINAAQVISIVVLAASGGFILGMIAFWFAVSLSRTYDPLFLAWINQNIPDSRVRATVISMSSQTDAIGQIAGGPLLGAIGTLASLRAAMYGSAVVLLPALALYTRAFRQGAPAPEPATTTDK